MNKLSQANQDEWLKVIKSMVQGIIGRMYLIVPRSYMEVNLIKSPHAN